MIKLNSEQKKAVETDSKKALLIAGAGSGKTRVLIERIAYMIEKKNVSPYEIIAQTFTRKAGQEIMSRLEKRIGAQTHKITVGTIHSVALNFLQKFGELIGLRPNKITIYNQWETDFLLKETAKELGYHSGYAWTKVKRKDVYKVMTMVAENEIFDYFEYAKELEIISAFRQRCRENNALTYDSILSTFLILLPEIDKYLKFKHVFVDEIQDNNKIQHEITNLICELSGASLFIVGDPSQSIYQFRGADPDYLIRNQSKFDIFKLQNNYRSDANIVNAANKLIKHNKKRLDLEMIPVKSGSNRAISIINNMDSLKIKKLIEHLSFIKITKKEKPTVLSRNHYLLEKLSRLLSGDGIDHEYIGKKSKMVHDENFIKFHAFLKLIVNPFDNFSFLLIKDILEIDQETYGKIRVEASEKGLSHFQIWKETRMDGANEIFKWFAVSKPGDIDTVIDWMKEVKFGFDTEPIFDFVYTWILDNYDKGLTEYLEWLSTYDIQDEIKKEPEKLQLMTCHAAKGLEFSTVIIAGLNEGIFPDKRSMKEDPNVQDERNLAYVAMTRAENQLILTYRPLKKDLFEVKNSVSRFIGEAL